MRNITIFLARSAFVLMVGLPSLLAVMFSSWPQAMEDAATLDGPVVISSIIIVLLSFVSVITLTSNVPYQLGDGERWSMKDSSQIWGFSAPVLIFFGLLCNNLNGWDITAWRGSFGYFLLLLALPMSVAYWRAIPAQSYQDTGEQAATEEVPPVST